jgi:2-polyprenyl-6-hydroxyphenyl methylase/3-demethylubiquinone-9 3-methyltransferase
MDTETPRLTSPTTLNSNESKHFQKFAHAWWEESGPFSILHKINPTRIAFILEALRSERDLNGLHPLKGLRILDVGCGGGLLCEPLTRLGATVVGIDAVHENIETAQKHAIANGLSIDYQTSTIESFQSVPFDVVIALEIIEHVDNPQLFLNHCNRLTQMNGCLILSTLNQTLFSAALGIFAAENILGWVPKGTHSWSKFIRPRHLQQLLFDLNFEHQVYKGLSFMPISGQWSLSDNLDINYLVAAFRHKNESPKKHFLGDLSSWG